MTGPDPIPVAFRAFARVLPEPVLLLSGDGRILVANPALERAVGYRLAELRDEPLAAFAADAPESLGDYLRRCSRTSGMTLGALTLRTKQGEERHFRSEGALLQPRDGPGHVLRAAPGHEAVLFLRLRPRETASSHFLVLNRKIEQLAREIHERLRVERELRRIRQELEERVVNRTAALERANAELERSNEALQHFAYIASHDLQEPLRKIRSFGELLEELAGDRLDDESRFLLDRIGDSAARMQRFIRDLLAYSRVTSEPGDFEPVALDDVVRDVLADLELRIEETGARIEKEPLPTIEADPSQMRQLVLNLLTNALKFHREGVPPHVTISGERLSGDDDRDGTGARCRLVVHDRGIGFAQEQADRIFDLFERLNPRSFYEGSGLGLAICKRIVERHGGTIIAESRPGEGAAFTITLPERQQP